jgi:hypothetical protein
MKKEPVKRYSQALKQQGTLDNFLQRYEYAGI